MTGSPALLLARFIAATVPVAVLILLTYLYQSWLAVAGALVAVGLGLPWLLRSQEAPAFRRMLLTAYIATLLFWQIGIMLMAAALRGAGP